jgi:isopentenyl-diphosphate delta-isomerase
MTEERVILVNDLSEVIGTAPKASVHHRDTPLHRAFSCFGFNGRGELLLQQRALHKVTWPGIWSNSVCGHPLPGEVYVDAVHRRLANELFYQQLSPWCREETRLLTAGEVLPRSLRAHGLTP